MSNISSNFLAISPSVNNSPFSFFTLAVPLVFTKKPTGLATPIAYATCTRISSATPAATIFWQYAVLHMRLNGRLLMNLFPKKHHHHGLHVRHKCQQ